MLAKLEHKPYATPYSDTLPAEIAAIMRAIPAPEGVTSFVTKAFNLTAPGATPENGPLIQYVQAFLLPGSNRWEIQRVRQDNEVFDQQTILRTPYIFDALHSCGAFAQENKTNPLAKTPEDIEDEPDYLTVCEQALIPVDEGLPIPAAGGKILVDGMFPLAAKRAAKKTKDIILIPVDHTTTTQAALAEIRGELDGFAQKALATANPDGKTLPVINKYNIRDYHEAINQAETFLSKTFDDCVKAFNNTIDQLPNFEIMNIKYKDPELKYKGGYCSDLTHHKYTYTKLPTFIKRHFGASAFNTRQRPLSHKIMRWWNGQTMIIPDEQKISDEISRLENLFATLPDEQPRNLLMAFTQAARPYIWLESAACLHTLLGYQTLQGDTDLQNLLTDTLARAATFTGTAPLDIELIQDAILRREDFFEPGHFEQKLERQLTNIKAMIGYQDVTPKRGGLVL